MDTQDSTARLAQLFREAGVAHHHAFAASNGEDPAWPVWYAEFLSPRLSALLGRRLSADRLAADLVIADRMFRDAGPRLGWPEYYAEWFLHTYRRPAARKAAL